MNKMDAIDNLMMMFFKRHPTIRRVEYVCAESPHFLGVAVEGHNGRVILWDNLNEGVLAVETGKGPAVGEYRLPLSGRLRPKGRGHLLASKDNKPPLR